MKVYRLNGRGSIDHLVLHEEEIPKPERGEILVRVRATSLNYRDLALVYGHYFTDAPSGLIPVSDAAGEVVEIGDGVTRFRAGDRVVNIFNPSWFGGPYPGTAAHEYGTARDGWLTEYKAVSEEALAAMPPGLSFEQASTLPCAAVTAWTALTGPHPVTAADTVLTQGTGGVSLFAVQLAKVLGARVIAITSAPHKAELLRSLGADDVIDYHQTPQWGGRVRALTGGHGADRIIEVGGASTFAESLRAGSDTAEIDAIGFLGTQDWDVDFMGLFNGGFETLRRIRVGSRQDTESLLRTLERHPIAPVIDSVHALDNAVDAWRHLDSRKNLGKVVVSFAA